MSKLFCIFDTNSLLLTQQHLQDGKGEKDASMGAFLGRLMDDLQDKAIRLLIPQMVLQELDGLKNSKIESAAYQSRCCTAALQTALLQQQQLPGHSVIEIQQKSQCIETLGPGDSNDDHILDCCLYWMKYESPYCLLITNDRNLTIKAMAHKILVLDPVSSGCLTSSGLLGYLYTLTPQHFKKDPTSPTMIVDDPLPSASEADNDHLYSMTIDMPAVLYQIYTILTHAFSKSLYKKLTAKGLAEKYSVGPNLLTLEEIFVILQKEHGSGFDSPGDYPPYFEKSQLTPILMVGKDIDRSVRQNMCTLTKGDLKSFIKKTSDYLFICGNDERTSTMDLLNEIIKHNL